MVLKKNEYDALRKEFLEKHESEMRNKLQKEYDEFVKNYMRDITMKRFIRKRVGGYIFALFIMYFLIIKDIIPLSCLVVFVIFELVFLAEDFGEWQTEMKLVARDAFMFKMNSIISAYIYDKMIEAVQDAVVGKDFEIIIQFFSIAIYEIPRNYVFLPKD